MPRREARRSAGRRGGAPPPCSLARAGRAAPLRARRARAMSAFCLGLAGRASAPAEPDSACCMELPAGAGDAVGSPAAAAAAALVSFPGGAGELELALEEELVLLAAGERPSDPGEHLQAEPGSPAEGHGPPPPSTQDPELLSVIRQKEKDLVLAARLGKALLERNQDMSRQYEQMHKELTDKLEVRTFRRHGWEAGYLPIPGQFAESHALPPSMLILAQRKSSRTGGRIDSFNDHQSIHGTHLTFAPSSDVGPCTFPTAVGRSIYVLYTASKIELTV